MKGWWESNRKNVWFPFMYSQKWNCYFQNRIIMFCLPVPALIYLWYILGLVCLFCCREICGMWIDLGNILIAHRHMNVEIGWGWGRTIPRKGTHRWDFPCSALKCLMEDRHYKKCNVLLWSEKNGATHHKILIFNSALSPRLQSLQCFLFIKNKR